MKNLPKFYETFTPILHTLKAHMGKDLLHRKQLCTEVRERFYTDLSMGLLSQETSTGANTLLDRIGWGLSYLNMANYVERPRRGYYRITQKGLEALSKGALGLDDVKAQPEYVNHRHDIEDRKAKEAGDPSEHVDIGEASPTDLIDEGIRQIEQEVKTDLLEKIRGVDPYDFEMLVLKLFKAMGYGDTTSTSKSNDGGIDGIINEDKLGLEKIYMQAKRFATGKVREPDIRNFIGAMSGDTNKGIFVTTSEFDEKAQQKATSAHHKIILIDGNKLVALMYEYGVGVQIKNSIAIKEVDEDFFEM